MKLVRPFQVTTAALTACNVAETPPAAWGAGTTYAAGDRVSVMTGTAGAVYESLAAGNTGNDPASSPAWWLAVGTAYSAYDAGTYYVVGDIVTDPANHLLYESLFGSGGGGSTNIGNPLTDTTKWLEIGPTNRWAMFDAKVGTQTARAAEVSAVIAVTGRADTVALLNVAAAAVNVTVTDGATEVHNEDYSLVATDGIDSWFDWLFEPVTRKTDLIVTGLPNVADPVVTITATDTGTVSIGSLIVGYARDIGNTEFGASVGIADYSRKTQDDFGNWYIVERGFSRKGDFSLMMESGIVDAVFNLLAQYRATPVLFIGSDDYTSTALFGFPKDWSIVLRYPTFSVASIQIEGL